MSSEHPLILFVGNPDRGHQFLEAVESLGWWAYMPQDASEALGIYISYVPDMVILDAEADPDTAEEVYLHLQSIQAENILTLTSDPRWHQNADVWVLPAGISHTDLAAHIAAFLGAETTPQG